MEDEIRFDLASVTKNSARMALDCHKKGYGEIIIPEHEYWSDTRRNSAKIALLRSNGSGIAAAANINVHPEREGEARIIAISVSPAHQNKGLGVQLLQELQAVYSDLWLTISLTAKSKAMLATALKSGLDISTDRAEIERRFSGLSGIYTDDRVLMTTDGIQEHDFYAKLLSRRGLDHFPTFYRPGSRHKYPYPQVLAKASHNVSS